MVIPYTLVGLELVQPNKSSNIDGTDDLLHDQEEIKTEKQVFVLRRGAIIRITQQTEVPEAPTENDGS